MASLPSAEQVMELLASRRSIRKFTGDDVPDQLIDQIMEAGRWSPSGLNNQPWRFVVVREASLRGQVAQHTKYAAVVRGAPVLVAVFIHKPSMYNTTKDHQSMGACLQNMLLMAHGLGLGAVWLGEILNQAEAVREVLEVDADHELMAVLALGRPAAPGASSRLPLDQLILARR